MNDKQFNSELEYEIRMNIMRKMLKNQAITEQEYKKIDEGLIKRYNPILGSLKAWKPLDFRAYKS